jgi:Na+:H+ antiporter
MDTETAFILLFVVASGVAIVARRLHLPYTIALVLAGLALGAVQLFEAPHLTRELLYAVFLPGLLFEAAFHLEFRDFWRDRGAIVALAVPGVAVGILVTALILEPVTATLSLAQGFTWRHAVVFGALIAATDPIAVVGMLKTLGAPRRLTILLEGESLLNDGTAIVLFALAFELVSGAHVSGAGLAGQFITTVGGGLAVGLVVGLVVSQVIRHVDDPMIEITLTTIAAYGSFIAAEQLSLSGVIATVTAGMLCGNYAARTGMSPSTRVAAETFWEYLAFALNSVVFLLIGLSLDLGDLVASWPLVLAAYGAVVLARGAVVLSVSAFQHATRSPWPRSWTPVLTWGGLRGGLSMVLALGLPAALPERSLLLTMTFGVVLLSILAQGLTMAPLLRSLGIVETQAARLAYDRRRGALRAARVALAELDAMERSHFASPDVLAVLRKDYEARVQEEVEQIRALHLDQSELQDEEVRRARRHLLLVEKQEIIEAFHRGLLTQEAYEDLLAAIDARLARLDAGEPVVERTVDENGPGHPGPPGDAAERDAGGS